MSDIKIRYNGEISNCLRHGKGTYGYPGGVFSYSGPWVEGDKHGSNCEFNINSFSQYKGDFNGGEITGRGCRKWEDGRIYEGEWVLGEMHGNGVWTSSTGKDKYVGSFANNQRHGQGTLTLSSGISYSGGFSRHKFDGFGSYSIRNRLFYNGNFIKGIANGKGKAMWTNIASYNGEWHSGLPHGKGIFILSDGSYRFSGFWADGHPIGLTDEFKVEFDKPLITNIDTNTDKKDSRGGKKENKEIKKKPNPSKKTAREDAIPSTPVCPGLPLLKLIIQQKVQVVPSTATKTTKHIKRNSFELSQSLSILTPRITLPVPSENLRHMKARLRPVLTDSATIDTAPILGDAMPLWIKSVSSLHDAAVSWHRFPPCTMRFIEGVNIFTGEEFDNGMDKNASSGNYMALDRRKSGTGSRMISQTQSSIIPDNNNLMFTMPTTPFRLSDGVAAAVTIAPGDLKGNGLLLGCLMDFKLDVEAIIEAVTSLTSLFVHGSTRRRKESDSGGGNDGDAVGESNSNEFEVNASTGAKHTVISVWSLAHRTNSGNGGGTDNTNANTNASRLELVLLVPIDILEEIAQIMEERSFLSNEGEVLTTVTTTAATGGTGTAIDQGTNRTQFLEALLWNECIWELRLNHSATIRPFTATSERDVIEETFPRSPRYDPRTFRCLARWSSYHMLAGRWHSLALTFRNNNNNNNNDSNEKEWEGKQQDQGSGGGIGGGNTSKDMGMGVEMEMEWDYGVQLVIDGEILPKDNLNNDNNNELEDMAVAWIPEQSFYAIKDTSTGINEDSLSVGMSNNLTANGNTNGTQSPSLPSLVMRLGERGFEGLLKVFLVYTEMDLVDPCEITSVYATVAREQRELAALIEEDKRLAEEMKKNLATGTGTTGTAENVLTTTNATAANESSTANKDKEKGGSSAKGKDAAAAKKKAVDATHDVHEVVYTTMPRDCTEVLEVKIYSRGGRAEMDRVIIPYNTPEGLYVLELTDDMSTVCLSSDQPCGRTPALPEDLPNLCKVLKALGSDYSVRLNISLES